METKVWGTTVCEIESPHFARHRLTLLAGSWCSFHFHHHRANRFILLSGVVRVVASYGWWVRHDTMIKGGHTEIPSLVAHQFQVLEAGEMIEEYWPDRGGKVYNGDIERLTTGGIGDLEFVRKATGIIIAPGESTLNSLRCLRESS